MIKVYYKKKSKLDVIRQYLKHRMMLVVKKKTIENLTEPTIRTCILSGTSTPKKKKNHIYTTGIQLIQVRCKTATNV